MNEYIGSIAALGAAMGWTISAVCWTSAGKRVGSLVVNTVRLVLALAMFTLYGWLVHGQPVPMTASAQSWLWLGISGVTGYFLCDLFLFRSFLIIGPRLTLLIFSLSPIVASLCGFWWMGERITPRQMLGMAIAMSGVMWVVMESPKRKKNIHFTWVGGLLAFLAMVSQGVAAVIAKIGLQEFNHPVAATQIRVIFGLACFIILMIILRRVRKCVDVFRDRTSIGIITIGSAAGPAIIRWTSSFSASATTSPAASPRGAMSLPAPCTRWCGGCSPVTPRS